jgi:hypothetical protein
MEQIIGQNIQLFVNQINELVKLLDKVNKSCVIGNAVNLKKYPGCYIIPKETFNEMSDYLAKHR